MNNENTELSLADIMNIFKRRIWWFLAIFLITSFISVIYVMFFAKPVYEASAQLLVRTSQSSISIPSAVTQLIGISNVSGGSDISTEIELIKSRDNIEKLIEKLNLMELFKDQKKIEPQDVVEVIREKWLKVESVKDTKIIKISIEHEDPKLAAEMVNNLIDIYQEMRSELTTNESVVKLRFIEKQLPRIEQELKDVEEEIKKFKEENQIYSLSEQADNLVKYIAQYDSKTNEITLNIQQAEVEIKAAEDLLKKVDQKIISSETISTNPVVQQLRSKLVDLQVQLSALLQNYSEDDRRVVTLKKQIEETQDLLQKEISKVVSAEVQTVNPAYTQLYTNFILKQAELQVLQATLSAVEKIRDEYLKKVSVIPAIEQKLFELERERQAKQTTYLALLSQYEEAKIGAAGSIDNIRIISNAVVPNKPSKPNKRLTVAIGGVLGIFLGILTVFLRDATDKRFRSIDEIKRFFPNEPLLGKISSARVTGNDLLISLQRDDEKLCDEFKQIAVKLLYEPEKIIGFTSLKKEEGKTYISSNLSYILSKMSQKVLLIDLNTHNPSIRRVFSIDENSSLKNEDFNVSLVKFSDKLNILTLQEEDNWPLSDQKLIKWIKDSVDSYDKIIVDMPPLCTAEGVFVSKIVDKIVAIICIGKTEKILSSTIEELQISGKLSGIVINEGPRK
ncbi:exopolysaccharide transport family protein [Pseudothermotoga elfii]